MSKAKVKEAEVVNTNQIENEDVSLYPTKSAKIRYYLSKGYKRSEIAKHMNIRYQHVRNVEVTLLKKDMNK
jgi:hypothetical protein